jgi:hypothetical protein
MNSTLPIVTILNSLFEHVEFTSVIAAIRGSYFLDSVLSVVIHFLEDL